jgi:hypothetical protein
LKCAVKNDFQVKRSEFQILVRCYSNGVSLLALGLATSVQQYVFLVNGFQQMIWASFPFFQQCLQYFCPKIQFAVGLSVFPWKFQAM